MKIRYLPLYQIDAFTDRLFAGNPAAVVPLEEWLPDELMQQIAAENNLAETAFFVGRDGEYQLRWFTPAAEINLCGHATLATAHLIFNEIQPELERLSFRTLSGELIVERGERGYVMDFPATPGQAEEVSEQLTAALGNRPVAVYRSRDLMAVFPRQEDVARLRPDFRLIEQLDVVGVIATAPGESHDFVSRFFAPRVGVPEDPVTGSAHTTLVPYWAERLQKERMTARQISHRGGELVCRLAGNRVFMEGEAVTFLKGEIILPE
ncbi:MAG: PhzF family phenazine biosynthesis protein [Calditrichia bacterium]